MRVRGSLVAVLPPSCGALWGAPWGQLWASCAARGRHCRAGQRTDSASGAPSTWIETRGRQHRVCWRTGQASPKKTFEPFASRDAAELFVDLARRAGSLSGALEYVRDPRPAILRKLLGMAPLPAPAQTRSPCAPAAGPPPAGALIAG